MLEGTLIDVSSVLAPWVPYSNLSTFRFFGFSLLLHSTFSSMPFSAEVAMLALLLETSKPELALWLLQEGCNSDLRSPSPNGLYPPSFSCFGPALVHTLPLLPAPSLHHSSFFLPAADLLDPSASLTPAPNLGAMVRASLDHFPP